MGDPVVEIKQGEGKWIKFTVTRAGTPLDLSGAGVVLTFGIKQKLSDTTYIHKVEDADFDASAEAAGIVRANVPASVTKSMKVGDYLGELKTVLTADTDVDKSHRITVTIKPAVIHE